MEIETEEYRKEFMFLECRFNDRKWFFCKWVMQYYCRSKDSEGKISPWTKIHGKFFTEEELVMHKLSGKRVYLNK